MQNMALWFNDRVITKIPLKYRKRTTQSLVYMALYDIVTDLWRKRGFTIIKRERIQIYEHHYYTKVRHKWRYRWHCVRSDNRLSCRGFGGGGCADTRVSPCLWLAHRKYVYWMLSSAWRGTYISLRQNLLLGDRLSQGLPIYLPMCIYSVMS